MKKDCLGDRMKEYEAFGKVKLDKTKPIIIRVDGKAFHTYTKGMEKPFDDNLIDCMECAQSELMKNIQNAVVSYRQSDEISVVVYNTNQYSGEIWFDGNKSKIETVSASIATAAFNKKALEFGLKPTQDYALFDSRAFNVPSMPEAVNCILWRMFDWKRNFVSSVAYSIFSHKQLQNKTTEEKINMISESVGINWKDSYSLRKQFGTISSKDNLYLSREPYSYEYLKSVFIQCGIYEFLFEESECK